MSLAQLKANTNVASDNSDVPAKLLETAIRLYGEQGCQAVSVRQIIKEAGVLNDAAVRYYFGNKQDLLRACVKGVALELRPIMQQAFADLDERKADASKPTVSARHVVAALFYGFAVLHAENSAASKLIARMVREEGAEGQQMQVEELGDIMWRFEDELAAVLPEKSAKAIRLQAVLAFHAMINGLVDHELYSTYPARTGQEEHPLTADELSQGFIDFLTLGIAGPASI